MVAGREMGNLLISLISPIRRTHLATGVCTHKFGAVGFGD